MSIVVKESPSVKIVSKSAISDAASYGNYFGQDFGPEPIVQVERKGVFYYFFLIPPGKQLFDAQKINADQDPKDWKFSILLFLRPFMREREAQV